MGPKNPENAAQPAQEETYELLTTKLAPPRLRPLFVPRQALLARLDGGLEHKLTLISAPAGFGKTTLVSEWIAFHRERHNLPRLAWVALDPGDNDPARFWRYVLTACKAFGEGISDPALALLNASPQPPIQTLLTLLINQAARLPSKAVLVLEDYHTITEAQVHEGLSFFIDHLPSTMHLILMTRSDPPLPLARLRARNELNELRAEDLRFSEDEARAFLEQAFPYSLSPEMVKELANRTEGWVAGLRLVSLALPKSGEAGTIEQFLDTFTGSHRPVLDYLIGDVFSAQLEPLQQFLLQTSILSRLTGSLCDAITGRDDSAQVLEQLERNNLFLVSLDASQQWYRFHALFAEAMQHYAHRRLGETRLHEFARMASLWYEEHGLLAEAVEASLFAQEHARAAGLIQRIIAPHLVQNENQTLRRWIEQIPEQALSAYPEICLPYATAILFTSDRGAPETKSRLQTPLQIAEEHWQRENNEARLGEVFAFRSLVDWLQRDYQESFSFAKQALARLPEGDRQWRGSSLIMVGMDQRIAGKLNAARQTGTEALALGEAGKNIYVQLGSMLLLGEVSYQQGELHHAAQIFNRALEMTENAPMDPEQSTIRRGQALTGLGMLALEWNDLGAAEGALTQAVATKAQFPGEFLLDDSPVILAQVKFARGEVAQAQQLAGSLVDQAKRSFPLRFPGVYQARLALASGDLAGAERWASTQALPGDDTPLIQLEQEALVVTRLRIAQGESGAAIDLLERWLVEAKDDGRTRSELEIQILLAQAYAALKERQQARQSLTRALALAEPGGYRRIFLDEGERLAMLLRDLYPEIREEPLAAYARALLYSMAEEKRRRSALPQDSQPLIEPLSEQEQRVLRLLAAGLSNPEIAEQLVISVNTVKTHVKNIYAKLNVNNREDARQAARKLKL